MRRVLELNVGEEKCKAFVRLDKIVHVEVDERNVYITMDGGFESVIAEEYDTQEEATRRYYSIMYMVKE